MTSFVRMVMSFLVALFGAAVPSIPVPTPVDAPAYAAPAPAPLEKPLRYHIGTDRPGEGHADVITEVNYESPPVRYGISIAYCNLFNENWKDQSEAERARYGPYLQTSDTAKDYREGQIDPRGPGWERNLREQFSKRKAQGFVYIELDNPDAYSIRDVLRAIDIAESYGLKVIAKNPGCMDGDTVPYLKRTHGIIVEKGCGTPGQMDALRRRAGKPDMPVWFVFFGDGRREADKFTNLVKEYRLMGVSYGNRGEYENSTQLIWQGR